MAAATGLSWKRPWQETSDAGVGTPKDDLAENLALASPFYNTFNQRTPSHPQSERPEYEPTQLPIAHLLVHDRLHGEYSPSRRDQAEWPLQARGPSLQNPYKRRCLQRQDGTEDMPKLRSTARAGAEATLTPRASLSSASAAETDDAHQKSYSRVAFQRRNDSVVSRDFAGGSVSTDRRLSGLAPTDAEDENTRGRGESDSCLTCDRASSVAPQIARGLETLHGQLRLVLARDQANQASLRDGNRAGLRGQAEQRDDLLASLDWSLEKLNASLRTAQDMMSVRDAPEPRDRRRPPVDVLKRPWEPDDGAGAANRRISHASSVSEEGLRLPELPPMRTAPVSDDRNSNKAHLSHICHPQSPAGAGSPSRVLLPLPSPASLNLPPLSSPGAHPTGSLSSSQAPPPPAASATTNAPPSPRTAHLQDLQHQLSTKTLAHSVLKAEHDKLLGAYARQQTRLATFDRKARVADAELLSLAEERARLRAEAESHEREIEALTRSRDEAQRQSAANGGQYMQIMAMSAKLQARGAEEEKRWKRERESWEEEREGLRTQIGLLTKVEEKDQRGADGGGTQDSKGRGGNVDALEEMDVAALREEVARLRREKQQAEARVEEYKSKALSITAILEQLSEVR